MGHSTSYRWAVLLATGVLAAQANPYAQGPNRATMRRAPKFIEITPAVKARIMRSKRVRKDPTSAVRTYSMHHTYDPNGWISLDFVSGVDFRGGIALIEGGSNIGSVSINFTPIAPNRVHMILFTISVAGGPTSSVVVQTMGDPPQTITVNNGTAYVPVTTVPPSGAGRFAMISATPGASIWFEKATIELVK